MITYPTHSIDTAPEASKPLLRGLQENLGMIPNLAAAMAESPQLLHGFLAVREIYQGGTFTPAEVQILSLTAAFENGCAWCMAFHTLMAGKEGVSQESIDALRGGRSPVEPRLGPLSDFAREMVRRTVTTLGTPQDVTLQELRIECFFPMDSETRRYAEELAAT